MKTTALESTTLLERQTDASNRVLWFRWKMFPIPHLIHAFLLCAFVISSALHYPSQVSWTTSYNLCHVLPSQKSLYSSLSSVLWKVHALLDAPGTVSGFLLLGYFSAINWPLLPFSGTLSYTENFSQPSLTCLTSQNESVRSETKHLLHGPPHHLYLSVKSSPQ